VIKILSIVASLNMILALNTFAEESGNLHLLFSVTNEQRKQICIEACKWALAKNIALAKETKLPKFVQSAGLIKTSLGLKKAFNYDDVDLSLFNGTPLVKHDPLYGLNFYYCGLWVRDAYWYGYLKTKEKDLRKALKLLGYSSFEEFIERLNKKKSHWITFCQSVEYKPGWTESIPSGARVFFSHCGTYASSRGIDSIGHAQLSLGKFGCSTNGMFFPGIFRASFYHGGPTLYSMWSFPTFEVSDLTELKCEPNSQKTHLASSFKETTKVSESRVYTEEESQLETSPKNNAKLKKELFSPEEWERMKKLGIVSGEEEKQVGEKSDGAVHITAGGRKPFMDANGNRILIALIPVEKTDEWGKFWNLDRSHPIYIAKIDEKFFNVTIEGVIPGIYELYAGTPNRLWPGIRHPNYDPVVFRFKINVKPGEKINQALSQIAGDIYEGDTAIGRHADFCYHPDPPPRSRPQISDTVRLVEYLCHCSISEVEAIKARLTTGEEKGKFEELSGSEIVVKKGEEDNYRPARRSRRRY